MNADPAWSEMLDEFRALGGVADNIRLGHGVFGRGLFPIDPAKPIEIIVPDNLLVSSSDVDVDKNAFRINPEAQVGARERAFLERYEQDFAWGPGHLETERFLAAMLDLPERVREMLIRDFDLGRFFNPVSPQLVQKWFFGSRDIKTSKGRVIMPIIELANHGGDVAYDRKSGVALRGLFEGEVLVRYARPTDSYDMFLNWMFSPNEPTAFSIKMVVKPSRSNLEIGRQFDEASLPFVPKVAIEGDRVVANYLLLGHQNFPRLPQGAFRRAMAHAGFDDLDEVFDFVQFANRQNFFQLLDAFAGVESPAADALRVMVLNQLKALSHHFGARPV
jgi:hypothetical protein